MSGTAGAGTPDPRDAALARKKAERERKAAERRAAKAFGDVKKAVAAGTPPAAAKQRRPRKKVASLRERRSVDMSRVAPDGSLVVPFTVVVDTREQHPFRFAGLKSDAKDGRMPLHVPVVVSGLASGDYSLAGYESHVAVERKSLADLYSTIAQGRERFTRELERLNAMQAAAVVIEASWTEILTRPPSFSRLPPKNVFRSILAWAQRFPRVGWWPCDGRVFAEIVTYRFLERFYANATAGYAGDETFAGGAGI